MARSSTHVRASGVLQSWLIAGGVLTAVAAGAAMALRPPMPFVLVGTTVAAAMGVLAAGRVGRTMLAVELPVVLLLLSTLVWRGRSSEAIATNPLDAAGAVRTCLVLAGALLGAFALLAPQREQARTRPVPLPLRLYGAYIVVVFLGALPSAFPLLTAYRGVELAAGVIVVLGARRAAPDALQRVEATLYWFTAVLLVNVWVGVVAFPSLALEELVTNAPVPWRVNGAYPSIASNTVGMLGVLLVFWSVARANDRWPGQRWKLTGMIALGLVSALAAQYRTGYVMVAVGLVVVLATQQRRVLLALVVLLLAGVVAWKPSLATDIVLRGDTFEQARELDSRMDWWEAALPIWRESPLIGRGLNTATRFEVFAALGRSMTSTIHGTWIEALVGTGIIGSGLLALTYLTALGRAATSRWRVGLLLLVLIGVRSLTGETIELFGFTSLLFAWACTTLPDGRHVTLSTPGRRHDLAEPWRSGSGATNAELERRGRLARLAARR